MTPDHDIDSEHVYPPHKWSAEMGKPFDEERAPRMDATSRAAAEIDRVHALEARIAILETELRACTRLRTENERLRVVALIGDAQHGVCEYDLEQSVNSLRDVEAERDLLRKIMYELTLEINNDYNGYCRYCGDDLNIEDADADVFYSDEPERHKADCPWRLAAEYTLGLGARE